MERSRSLNYVFTFGKYKGEKWRDVAEKNINYLWWCAENVKDFKLNFFNKLTDDDRILISKLDWENIKRHKRVLNKK